MENNTIPDRPNAISFELLEKVIIRKHLNVYGDKYYNASLKKPGEKNWFEGKGMTPEGAFQNLIQILRAYYPQEDQSIMETITSIPIQVQIIKNTISVGENLQNSFYIAQYKNYVSRGSSLREAIQLLFSILENDEGWRERVRWS